MPRYIYVNRSNLGTGCGCLFLTVFVAILLIRTIWLLLPFLGFIVIGLLVYSWLTGNHSSEDRRDRSFYNPHQEEEDGPIVRPTSRSIKEAEIIDDDD